MSRAAMWLTTTRHIGNTTSFSVARRLTSIQEFPSKASHTDIEIPTATRDKEWTFPSGNRWHPSAQRRRRQHLPSCETSTRAANSMSRNFGPAAQEKALRLALVGAVLAALNLVLAATSERLLSEASSARACL